MKRVIHIGQDGDVALVNKKGDKCKNCKNSATPANEEPCLSCLKADGYPKFSAKSTTKEA